MNLTANSKTATLTLVKLKITARRLQALHNHNVGVYKIQSLQALYSHNVGVYKIQFRPMDYIYAYCIADRLYNPCVV